MGSSRNRSMRDGKCRQHVTGQRTCGSLKENRGRCWRGICTTPQQHTSPRGTQQKKQSPEPEPKPHRPIISVLAYFVNPPLVLSQEPRPIVIPFLTKESGCVTIAPVIIELDAHPEGWRDRPNETPATSWQFEAQGLSSSIQRGANSGRVHRIAQVAVRSLEDERLRIAKSSHRERFFSVQEKKQLYVVSAKRAQHTRLYQQSHAGENRCERLNGMPRAQSR